MSSSDRKSDEYPPPLYRQGSSSGKVGYFKHAHVKINFDEFVSGFSLAVQACDSIWVRVNRVKDDSGHQPCGEGVSARKRAIKFHMYYFVLGFTFPMSRIFQEVICSMNARLLSAPQMQFVRWWDFQT